MKFEETMANFLKDRPDVKTKWDAIRIIEIFEDLLEAKGVEIPCDDPYEESHRYDDMNLAAIYGTEYGNLVNAVSVILEELKGENDEI